MLLLLKANRNRSASLVLIPHIVMLALFSLMAWGLQILGVPSIFGTLLRFPVAGLTLLWLLAHKLSRCAAFIQSLGIIALPGLVFVLASGTDATAAMTAALSVLGLSLLLTSELAFIANVYRRRRTRTATIGWAVAVAYVAPALIMTAVFIFVFISSPGDFMYLLPMSAGGLILVCFLGTLQLLLLMPYLLLTLNNKLFNRRLRDVLGIENEPTPPSLPTDD